MTDAQRMGKKTGAQSWRKKTAAMKRQKMHTQASPETWFVMSIAHVGFLGLSPRRRRTLWRLCRRMI